MKQCIHLHGNRGHARDYYETLGVKGSLRKGDQEGLPQRPPVSPRPQIGDKQAESQFKEAQVAYDVLSDKQSVSSMTSSVTPVRAGSAVVPAVRGGFRWN